MSQCANGPWEESFSQPQERMHHDSKIRSRAVCTLGYHLHTVRTSCIVAGREHNPFMNELTSIPRETETISLTVCRRASGIIAPYLPELSRGFQALQAFGRHLPMPRCQLGPPDAPEGLL